jgi:hypothetical protein
MRATTHFRKANRVGTRRSSGLYGRFSRHKNGVNGRSAAHFWSAPAPRINLQLIYGCTHPGSIKPDEFTGKPDYRDKSFASELKDFIPVYANITRDNISIDQSFFLSHFILNTWMMSSPGRVYVCFLAFLRVGVTMRMLCPGKAEAFSKKNDLFGALPSCISAPTLFVRPDI